MATVRTEMYNNVQNNYLMEQDVVAWLPCVVNNVGWFAVNLTNGYEPNIVWYPPIRINSKVFLCFIIIIIVIFFFYHQSPGGVALRAQRALIFTGSQTAIKRTVMIPCSLRISWVVLWFDLISFYATNLWLFDRWAHDEQRRVFCLFDRQWPFCQVTVNLPFATQNAWLKSNDSSMVLSRVHSSIRFFQQARHQIISHHKTSNNITF